MTPSEGATLLQGWLSLLKQIDSVILDGDLAPDELTERLDKRQQAINGIQQLDTQLKKLALLRKNEWKTDRSSKRKQIEDLLTEGREILARISEQDSKIIEITKEKRQDLLEKLRRNTLSKGYRPAGHGPQIRPPIILDGRA